MIRDPFGPASLTRLNRLWHANDVGSWTEDYRSQVPDQIDPLDSEYS